MKRANPGKLLALIVLLEMSAFGLLSLRDETFDPEALLCGGILLALLIGSYWILTKAFRYLDRHLLIIADVLISIGMIVQYRINPDIAFKQMVALGLGVAVMAVLMLLLNDIDRWKSTRMCWVYMIGSVLFLMVPLAIGTEQYGAKNWIDLGFFSLQPGEFVKLALVMVLAIFLSERRRISQLLGPGTFLLALMAVLVLERDLGAALIYAGTAVVLYYCATGNLFVTAMGLGAGAGAAVICYKLFAHVRVRVNAWRNPWATYYDQGYQIAQGLMAIASGGLFGMGLTLGVPKVIPAYHTDYIFAVICEEMGIIVGLCVVALYVLFALRGISIALKCTDRFSALVAIGCTTLIVLQSFIILGGVIKLIPLTGVTLPFVSYGGSSMMSSLLVLGLLESVAVQNGRRAGKGDAR